MKTKEMAVMVRKPIPYLLLAGSILAALAGCDTLVGGAISTVDSMENKRESERLSTISQQSQARYKAMADRGDPKGLYYMAVVHAAKHMNERGGDAYTVKRMYEEAMAKGSNDAKVALGNMLICGYTGISWGSGCGPAGLPIKDRDPVRGMALLKEAAAKSCSVTEPLIAYGNCRERETSIPALVWLIYRDGDGGIPEDSQLAAQWKARAEACAPIIDQINKQRGC
jgi:TPR repeat protein